MEEERRDEGGAGKVRALIEMATDSTEPDVDPRLLKAIKSVVRNSDSELRFAAHTLMDLMKRDHSQIRYLTLIIIDQLFMRSKLFRNLIIENMDKLLALSVGFRNTQPLPDPPAVATLLRTKAIEFLEKWNDSFGIHYRHLRLGVDYLKNTLRFQFPNLQANAARRQQERREREKRTKEILLKKFETLKESFSSIKDEIQSTIDEIGECLDIVRSGDENKFLGIPLDEEDFEEIRSSELRQIRLEALEIGEKVHENNDNKVVFDALRELYKLLVTKHLVTIQEWTSVLVRVDLTDYKFRDCALKEFIDIRNRLQLVKKKCEESGCMLQSTGDKDEEEDFWEEGKIEVSESLRSSTPHKQNEDLAKASTSIKLKNRSPECSGKEPEKKKNIGCKNGDPLRSTLLAQAPVLNWDSHLDNWDSKRDLLANHRGLELESHWGRVDNDAVIPAEKIAELNIRATLYKEDHVEIQPCRAPLRKGGLCERRDLRVCPFHGPITPRDNEGKPLDQSPPEDKATSNIGTDLVEQLARQAMKNVREKDREAAKEREIDKKSLKRAKLMKIREHNAAVLKDASLASTSRSAAFGEETEDTMQILNPLARNKKRTVSSMLRKKVTAKDRIAQRLVSSQAREARIKQLTSGEDIGYREAFANQW
ncbi:hypothetical protein UlMin_021030 [Ulmus minor]